jgi:signal transduction histidine kinase
MRKTIFVRYFLRSVLLLTLTTMALTASFIIGASQILSAQQEAKMHAAALRIREYMTPHITGQGVILSRELGNVLPLMADMGELHISIQDTEGTVVIDSGGPASESGATLSLPITVGGVEVGHVLVGSYPNRRLLLQFFHNWALMSVIVVLLSGVTAYFSARRQTRPLRQMAACARSFERGDFTARADVESFQDDEIHDLAQAFNGMAETLQRGEELRRGFIANVSHELKTPMTTISGYIGGVLDGTVPEEKRAETLLIVRDEVMRLSRLVESSAGLARLETGQLELHPRPFELAELALRILLGLEQRVEEKGLSVDLNVPGPEPLYVYADPDSITQVLTNLLDNAVKFSDPGGELRLSVRPQAGKVRVSVTNGGQTIPEGDLPHVFERFFKADRSRSHDKTGLGLGLFLVRKLLNAHDEDITVTCSEGRTEFSFTLPSCKGPQ